MRTFALLVVGTAVALGTALTFAADSCGGGCPAAPKVSRAVSAEGIPLPTFCSVTTCPTPLVWATLAAGKRRRILHAEGLLTDGPYLASAISRAYVLDVNVNGLPMQPHASGATEIIEDCGLARDPDVHCSAVGHWWLDLDDPANAALVDAPITVTLTGGDYLGSAQVGSPVDVSLRIRLEEK